jgi:protein-S-isoprenylcysteine O-methyltransferase Ste14
MRRFFVLQYGLVAYAIGMASLVYLVAWLGNLFVPHSIDSAPTVPMHQALLVNAVLFGIFAVQHSVMARPKFKQWWTRYVPKPMERSTYVFLSGLALFLLMAFWQPIGIVVWEVQQPIARAIFYGLYALGWCILVGSTFVLNHFDLFGLRQVWLYFRGKPYTHLHFATPGPYRVVRHPLYVGWITLAWATPTMSLVHLVFALATTAYILVAIQFEERDLVAVHGDSYVEYRRCTPMLVPVQMFIRTDSARAVGHTEASRISG